MWFEIGRQLGKGVMLSYVDPWDDDRNWGSLAVLSLVYCVDSIVNVILNHEHVYNPTSKH